MKNLNKEHSISLNDLLLELKATTNGLSTEEAANRLQIYGHNIVERAKRISVLSRYFSQYKNFFAILLLIGAALSFVADYLAPHQGNFYIGIALLVVTIINASFTFYQEFKADKIMQTFINMMPHNVKVIRDDVQIEISAQDLVPGDIILLSEGDKIPADGRLIEQNRLKVDNATLTGESEPQLRSLEPTHKNILESRNVIFSGTSVLSGTGKAIIYATGMDTQLGQIASLTSTVEKDEIPIRKELKHFVKIISILALLLGVAFFTAGLFLDRSLWHNIVYMIGIIVANVPEGLLPTVTLCLSIAAQRMAKKKALVKNLESVETLGSTTVICTDKTGTITENKMQVNQLFINGTIIAADRINLDNSPNLISEILKVFILCNNSHLKEHANKKEPRYIGDPMEGALLDFAHSLLNYKKIRESHPRIVEEPFDSNTKRMITVNTFDNRQKAYLKGAPEVVIKKCSKIYFNDEIIDLTEDHKNQIIEAYANFSLKGERVLAAAFKPNPELLQEQEHILTEEEFVFLGLVALLDPPRKEVKGAVEKCRAAGIKVIMITGDFSITAESIARKVGIITTEKPVIITGDELEEMSDSELKHYLNFDEILFARTNPLQKLKVVQNLQKIGHTVAITGDGVNDAPAIKNADIGVSMGLCGTDVAKEASDMVLMDDNFATIVNAVEEGRTIFDNIKKFTAYILTSNIPELIPFVAFVLLGVPLPLTVALILCIDLGTDIIPALGLGSEKPEKDIMQRKPRSKKEHLISRNLILLSYGIIGVIEAAAGFCAYFYVLFSGGWHFGEHLAYRDPLYQQAITAFFVSIIICQIFNVMARRARSQTIFNKHIFSNKIILLGIATEILIILLIMYLPAAQTFFNTRPLSLEVLAIPIPFGFLILLGDELRRYLIRKKNKFVSKYLSW